HPIFAENNDSREPSAGEITKWQKELEEVKKLWVKQDTDKGIPKSESLLSQTELVFGKDSPVVGVVLYRIGLLYGKRGDFDRAVPYLERSLKLVSPLPDNAENLAMKADLYWGLGGIYAIRSEFD